MAECFPSFCSRLPLERGHFEDTHFGVVLNLNTLASFRPILATQKNRFQFQYFQTTMEENLVFRGICPIENDREFFQSTQHMHTF